MLQPLNLRLARGKITIGQWLILAAGAALIALSVLVRPANHDEGQYVAAIALMRGGLPYRDFPYLQTPLQPLLLSPLAAIPAGWLLVAVRAANGLFALITAWLLLVQLRGRVRSVSAAIGIAALLCTNAFLLAASCARNDALPLFLLTAAQGAMLAHLDREKRWLLAGVAGLLFGLAVSTKINAALPAAGAGLFLLLQLRRDRLSPLAFAAGILLGLLPCVIMAAIAPWPFRFGVFSYSLSAPAQWWTAIGEAGRLQPATRILRLLLLAFGGVIAVGLAATLLDRRKGQARRMLEMLILGGVIGSYLPEPAFAQYLVPLLPAVVARLAFALDAMPRAHWRIAAGAIALSSGLGLLPTARHTLRAWRHGPDLVRSVEAGRAVSRLAAGRPVVTLSPERVAGSGVTLDPRFATGPFLFRTFGPLGDDSLRYGQSPNRIGLGAALDRQPPAVVVVGGESRPVPPLNGHGLDAPLQAWAVSRGYRPIALPGGQLTAYVRSAAPAAISNRTP